MDVQQRLHAVAIGEGEARAPNLVGEILRPEDLLARHHQQIVLRLLPVAQEQVFADDRFQHAVDGVAILHRVRCGVIRPLIGDAQAVEQVIDGDFAFKPPARVGGPALLKLHGGDLLSQSAKHIKGRRARQHMPLIGLCPPRTQKRCFFPSRIR